MPTKTKPPSLNQNASGDNNIVIGRDVNGVVIAGNNNTVNQTVIQKFFNIFRSDTETTEQRNRRIMLGHVENFWIKGILEKSLYGVALLELGIKENPDALQYPWAIKREISKETLPAGMSMLQIFQEIGMGRSLLILGAPGSGKTTMLLELARKLIERAHKDLTEPIPLVFNLSSWKNSLSLTDWLVRELNVIYTIPEKVASTWVQENKALLLLDGLDEVKQEDRAECVNAINEFRRENGLTNVVVSSRIKDYTELRARLSFNGAIEIQPLTPIQVKEYFRRLGEKLIGIGQVLEKDTILREMAENPLFLTIMTLAYRDAQSTDILVSKNIDMQRKHLFDIYIKRMLERPRSRYEMFKKQDVLHSLSWLANKLSISNNDLYLIQDMQPNWLGETNQLSLYKLLVGSIYGLIVGLSTGLIVGAIFGLIVGSISGLVVGAIVGRSVELEDSKIFWIWDLKDARKGLILALIVGLSSGLIGWIKFGISGGLIGALMGWLLIGLVFGVVVTLPIVVPFMALLPGGRKAVVMTLRFVILEGLKQYMGLSIVQHYILRIILSKYGYLPLRPNPFLDFCVDRLFLRKVGNAYIFVHRLLMEHFAAMYPEVEK